MDMDINFNRIKGFVFDLDGVVVDTRPYHMMAWQHVADDLGVHIDIARNEVLRGLSRMQSLEKVLEWGNLYLTEAEKLYWTDLKNNLYLDLIAKMTPDEVLPGVRDFLQQVRNEDCRTALVSSSRNARVVLGSVDLEHFFDVVIDGNITKKSKPAPDCFLLAAEMLQLRPSECIVFDDAPIGVQAAKSGGFATVAVGMHSSICYADTAVDGFENLSVFALKEQLSATLDQSYIPTVSIN